MKKSSRKSKGRTEKFIPEFLRARSDASKKAWEKRWDRGTAPMGTKGREYIERTYGPVIEGQLSQERKRKREAIDEYEEFDDFDFYEVEY